MDKNSSNNNNITNNENISAKLMKKRCKYYS